MAGSPDKIPGIPEPDQREVRSEVRWQLPCKHSFLSFPYSGQYSLRGWSAVRRFSDLQSCGDQWLDENAYKYGFVKRYPEDKTDITGISNEPWHYRYVGTTVAKIMKEENLCLEEYLEKYK